MPDLLQSITYELVLSQDFGVVWQVARIEVVEALNEPYRALLDVRCDELVDTAALLGCDAALSFGHGLGKARAVCGVISRVDVLGHVDHEIVMRLHVVPAMELLHQRVNSRIWQQVSLHEILQELLGEELGAYGREFDLSSLARGTKPRDYCVQYRESDFAFVSRLLEDEGISYEFTHDAGTRLEMLTLRDANEQYAELDTPDGTAELPLIAHNPSEADVESVQVFEWSSALTRTSALRRDYDWHTPRHVLSASRDGRDARGRERQVYAHGQRRFIHDDLQQRATDMHEHSFGGALTAYGRSNVTGLRPGVRFKLSGHDLVDPEQQYLVTRVVHSGAEVEVSAEGAGGQAYANEFECLPIEAELRPPLFSPRPREYGPQTAIVVGPEHEDIHTDEWGRIQVQFHWERKPGYQAEASCWVRCSQSWAGLGWGAQFIPRVGMEVVVEFIEGDPDRPLVTGCVYNAEYPPPFSLPDHKTQSGWRTESTPGGRGSNELRFEDAAGDEEIYLHGEKNWTIDIEHDKQQHIGHDEQLTVDNDRSRTIGHDEHFTVANDQTGRVGHDQTLSVGANQIETIGLSRTETVGVSVTQTVGAALTVTVGATLTTSVGQAHTLSIGADASETVAGDKTVTSDKLEITTAGDMTLVSGKRLTVDVGDRVSVIGAEKLNVDAAEEMLFTCGEASITLKKDGTIQIAGKDISIKGSGNVVVKGQQLAGN